MRSFSHVAAALGRNFAGVHKYAAKQAFGFGRRSRRDPTPTIADILALAGS